jgi:hypothetical protein
MPVLTTTPGVVNFVRPVPPFAYFTRLTDMTFPADQEMALDDIVSDADGTGTTVWGEGIYTTNHKDKARSLGANVLCGDGHVVWRPMSGDLLGKNIRITVATPAAAYYWIPSP